MKNELIIQCYTALVLADFLVVNFFSLFFFFNHQVSYVSHQH